VWLAHYGNAVEYSWPETTIVNSWWGGRGCVAVSLPAVCCNCWMGPMNPEGPSAATILGGNGNRRLLSQIGRGSSFLSIRSPGTATVKWLTGAREALSKQNPTCLAPRENKQNIEPRPHLTSAPPAACFLIAALPWSIALSCRNFRFARRLYLPQEVSPICWAVRILLTLARLKHAGVLKWSP
jgi:hypothetical protein